ncbi:MAG: hypothetical protein ABIP20_03715 [Chthoniobacteraceae bacterium]
MRHLLILAPLVTLLLASCEPGQENAGTGSRTSGDRTGGKLPAEAANHERLAAQDSVGRPPLPRDLVSTVGDICPVHHIKMKLCQIPIVFGDTASEGTGLASLSATADFPFGAEKIVSAGNALLPGEPVTARVYQCASCIAARRAAKEKRIPPAPTASLK